MKKNVLSSLLILAVLISTITIADAAPARQGGGRPAGGYARVTTSHPAVYHSSVSRPRFNISVGVSSGYRPYYSPVRYHSYNYRPYVGFYMPFGWPDFYFGYPYTDPYYPPTTVQYVNYTNTTPYPYYYDNNPQQPCNCPCPVQMQPGTVINPGL